MLVKRDVLWPEKSKESVKYDPTTEVVRTLPPNWCKRELLLTAAALHSLCWGESLQGFI